MSQLASDHWVSKRPRSIHAQLAALAVNSLYVELVLYPKPGLVSLLDSGSHRDMHAPTLMRSLFSLRHYFVAIARAGARLASFSELRSLGQAAEMRMLAATLGINTHRGAIFALGMLVAAAAAAVATSKTNGQACTPVHLRRSLLLHWGVDLRLHMQAAEQSHGSLAVARYGIAGARAQAAAGFPAVFEAALPKLRQRVQAGYATQAAQVECVFGLIAELQDSNLYHRGGAAGAAFAQSCAREFLKAGGIENIDWRAHAIACHRDFVRLGLSPGGAADLFAATWFVHQVEHVHDN